MFSLENVVPWGRSFDEYCRMFALSKDDLQARILGCADGPASFNAELTERGGRVVSCDPLYRFDARQIRRRIDYTYHTVMDQTRQNQSQFVWSGRVRSVGQLGRIRMTAMQRFLDDYEAGRERGRYIDAELTALPFEDDSFDLALCSHFLFLYGEQLSEDFHVQAVRQMHRVAAQCRIFPLLELDGRTSRYLDPAIARLERAGMTAAVERVEYEFQRGGDKMLRVTWHQAVTLAISPAAKMLKTRRLRFSISPPKTCYAEA